MPDPRGDIQTGLTRVTFGSRAQLDRALAKRAWLVPVAVAVFGGADPIRRGQMQRRDLRDWTEIGEWARKVLALASPGE